MQGQSFADMYGANFFAGYDRVTATRKPWLAAIRDDYRPFWWSRSAIAKRDTASCALVVDARPADISGYAARQLWSRSDRWRDDCQP